jgi:hypothetical protein
MVQFTKSDAKIAPDLHNTALDAGAMVPALGRLQLWNEIDKVSETNPGVTPRVLNFDTDSIYYKWYPEDKYPGVYNIPEGDMLGDWERETDGEHGGIVEFVGLGPKTYSYKCMDGYMSAPKTKGVRLGYSTEKIVNFETFKKLALEQLRMLNEDMHKSKKRRVKPLMVPQINFINKKTNLCTVKGVKQLGIDMNGLKGDIDGDGYLWPFGYWEAPERVRMDIDWEGYTF